MLSVIPSEKDVLTDGSYIVEIKDVDESNCSDKAVIKGKISTKWPVQTTKSSQLMKLALKAVNQDAEINVFIFGQCAVDCKDCRIGDTMFISGALVEKCTHRASHRCQLIVDPAKTKPHIWVVKKKGNPDLLQAIAGTSGLQNADASSSNRRVEQKRYQYTSLKDIKSGMTVNLYGVVKFFKPPKKGRGTDHYTLVVIMDDTVTEDEKLTCMLFADINYLPKIKNVGDIVRFHRLRITTHNGALQGQGGPGFSCLTFDRQPGGSMDPHSTTSRYTITDWDKEKVERLRQWRCDELPLSQDTAARETNLSAVAVGQYFDLVCQVLAVCQIAPDAVLFRVWDGSKVHVPVQQEILNEELARKLRENRLLVKQARDCAYDVKVYDNHVPDAVKVKPGDFVKLYNLHAAKYKGGHSESIVPTVEFCLHGGTSYGRRLAILPAESEEVGKLKRILNEVAYDIDSDSNGSEESVRFVDSDLMTVDSQDERHGADGGSDVRACDGVLESGEEPGLTVRTGAKRKSSDGLVDGNGGNNGGVEATGEGKQRRLRHEDESRDVHDESTSSDRMCMQVNASVITSHHHIKTSSLSDVNQGQIPNKYRVRVKVVEYQPKVKSVEEFLHFYCPKCHFWTPLGWREGRKPHIYVDGVPRYQCPKCLEKGLCDDDQTGYPILEYTYALRFLLRDTSDRTVVQLWREHAVTFFNGIEPADLLRDKSEFEQITARLDYIVGGSTHSLPGNESSAPWLECCVKSYTTNSGPCYQIFDTALCFDT